MLRKILFATKAHWISYPMVLLFVASLNWWFW